MKMKVGLDAQEKVVEDLSQAEKVIETEYDDNGRMVKETVYLKVKA
jgi:YD repeat-containing protein